MKKNFNRRLLALLIWMLVIFVFSQQSGNESSQTSGIIMDLLAFLGLSAGPSADVLTTLVRKTAHFTEYFILAVLFYRYAEVRPFHKIPLTLLTVGFVFLYACSDELHQSFVPGRGPAFTDVLIDTAGGLTGTLLYRRRKQKKNRALTRAE